jgi:hypothetical protein
LSVPFMTWCNVRIQHAIGTSSALGLPISLAGAAGYTISGWAIADLPEHHVGYVYLPALLCIALVSTLTAPLGAKLAHRLPVSVLKKVFAGVLMLLAAKMLHTVVAGRAVPPGGEQVSQNAHRASRSSWTQARLGFVATWTDLGLWKLTCRQNEDGGRNPPPIVVARTFTVLDRPPHPGGVGVFPSRDRF